MSGYELVLDQLRAAGNAAISAGEQARRVDLADAVAGVPPALPDAHSAEVIATVAATWARQVTAWSTAVGTLGAEMVRAEELYAANEADAERGFRVPATRLGPS
ncbi:hypothetical protein ACTG9Q_04760 [Actinokineospora sp. 24-640]